MGGASTIRTAGSASALGGGIGLKTFLSSASTARPAKPASTLSVPSASVSRPSFAASATVGSCSNSPHRHWEEVEIGFVGSDGGFDFGPVPSMEEAVEAVSTLQRILIPVTQFHLSGAQFPSLDKKNTDSMLASTETMEKVTSAEQESNRIKPAQQLHRSKLNQSQGQDKVFDAFRLLQFNPSVQRMVVSLSSDKAVWDAVMKNEVVQEFQKNLHEARIKSRSSEECPDVATAILRWILDNTKAKIMELINKITSLVTELFHSQEKAKNMEIFGDVVRSSFMLSVMVFIIVIVARFGGA